MMVLASVYLSVSNSLPSTPVIKPVEVWLLFNLAYPFLVIITNILLEVGLGRLLLILKKSFLENQITSKKTLISN